MYVGSYSECRGNESKKIGGWMRDRHGILGLDLLVLNVFKSF